MTEPEEKYILVVDDEEDVREYLAMALEDAGFVVERAADGNEALKKIKARVPDFISLDLVMPGKSGIKLLHELRRNKEWRKIPFVIVTAHARDDMGAEDLSTIMSHKTFSGPSVYLEKPVEPEQYVSFISSQLGIEKTKEEQNPHAVVREKLQKMIETAEPEKLLEALRLLKEK